MIARLSYVMCDLCGTPADPADDAREARAIARHRGFTRGPGTQGRRRDDICKECRRTHAEAVAA